MTADPRGHRASGPEAERTVFGFRIGGTVPLRFLRFGGGVEPLEIVAIEKPVARPSVEPLGDWPLQGTAYPARATLYRVPSGYEYWTTDAGRYLVDLERGRIEVPTGGDEILREQRLHGMPMILSFLARGDLSLHAAAVEVGGRAVILAAPSQFGKTTLAFAFQRQGHRVLSEDLVCCRPDSVAVIPGPAVLRLRPDVYDPALPGGLSVVRQRPDRVFVGFAAGLAGSGAPVPIAAVVFLRGSDQLRMEPVPAAEALKDLWRLSFRTGTEEGRAESFRRLTRLAGAVEAWNVHRPLELSALEATVRLIAQRIAA